MIGCKPKNSRFETYGNDCGVHIVSNADAPELPLNCLRELARWFHRTRTPAAIMGGIAAAVFGVPRITRDIDVLIDVPVKRWGKFVAGGEQYGFEPRGEIQEVLDFARESRVLLLSHRESGIPIDVVVAEISFEREAVRRGRRVRVAGCLLPLVSPEDLFIMKASALRGRDLADMAAIAEMQPRLDLARIRKLTRDFAAVLDRPEIVAETERLLSLRPARRRLPRKQKKR